MAHEASEYYRQLIQLFHSLSPPTHSQTQSMHGAIYPCKMVEGNYLCETSGCGNPATAFGLKDSHKLKSCDLHLSALIAKQMTIHGIDGYDFIATPQDALVYGERKAAVNKGIGNLIVQEANLVAEYAAALRVIEAEKEKLTKVVEVVFAEIRETVAERHSAVKVQFVALTANLNQYLKHRENSLLPSAELLCAELKSTPTFIQLRFGDASEPVSQTINSKWSVTSADMESLLKSAVSADLQPASVEAAQRYYSEGGELYKSKQWRKAMECYQKAREMFTICAPASIPAAINLNDLGLLLTDTKRWSEAEECHRQAQAIFDRVDSQSIEAARNLTNLAWLHYCTDRFGEAEQCYLQAMRLCGESQRNTNTAAFALKGLGLVRYKQQRYSEAEDYYKQAQRILDENAPRSLDAGKNYQNIGAICRQLLRWKEAEENYIKAKSIYEVEDPQSSQYANCLFGIGLVYEAQGKAEESIASFLSAAAVFTACKNEEWKAIAESSIIRVQAKQHQQERNS